MTILTLLPALLAAVGSGLRRPQKDHALTTFEARTKKDRALTALSKEGLDRIHE
jgi:hypothetical protein